MKTRILFVVAIIFVCGILSPQSRGANDTCEVLSYGSVLAYSHVEVGVRVFTDSLALAAVTIPLTWNSVTTNMTCDSVQWSDWFWNTPTSTYSGGLGQENYIDSLAREIRIMSIWWWSPYLPIDHAILVTLHFTIGEIDIIEPDGGEEWTAGEGKWIRWSPECDWNVNDSVVVDSFRPKTTTELYQAVNFADSSGRPIGHQDGETMEFKRGYLVRAPQSSDSVKIEYSYDAGKTWNLIASSIPNNGQLFWSSIPDTPSDSCLIRVTSKAQNPISATSADFFAILSDTTDVVEEKREKSIPQTFVLHQNYPNPFNPSTKIEFSLPRRTRVTLDIYNIAGQNVKGLVDEELPSGHWSVVWNGEDDNGVEVASGVYLYRLRTSEYTQTEKMLLVR